MKFRFFVFISLAVFSFSLGAVPVYAGKKDTPKEEAQKKIDGLNQQLKEATEKGDLQAGIDAAEEVLEKSSQAFGDQSLETAHAKNNLANLYMFAGHPENAERLYKESILVENKKDGESLTVADSFYNLSMSYAMQKKYDQARQMMDRAYKIRLKKLGPDAPDTQKAADRLKEISSEN